MGLTVVELFEELTILFSYRTDTPVGSIVERWERGPEGWRACRIILFGLSNDNVGIWTNPINRGFRFSAGMPAIHPHAVPVRDWRYGASGFGDREGSATGLIRVDRPNNDCRSPIAVW